jgi:hypothetical protein
MERLGSFVQERLRRGASANVGYGLLRGGLIVSHIKEKIPGSIREYRRFP